MAVGYRLFLVAVREALVESRTMEASGVGHALYFQCLWFAGWHSKVQERCLPIGKRSRVFSKIASISVCMQLVGVWYLMDLLWLIDENL